MISRTKRIATDPWNDVGYMIGYIHAEARRSLDGLPHSNRIKLERETGLEPATLCLGSRFEAFQCNPWASAGLHIRNQMRSSVQHM